MPRKRYKTEQIMALLRQVEVLVTNGRLPPQACREGGHQRTDILSLAQGIWRSEAGPGQTVKSAGAGKRQA